MPNYKCPYTNTFTKRHSPNRNKKPTDDKLTHLNIHTHTHTYTCMNNSHLLTLTHTLLDIDLIGYGVSYRWFHRESVYVSTSMHRIAWPLDIFVWIKINANVQSCICLVVRNGARMYLCISVTYNPSDNNTEDSVSVRVSVSACVCRRRQDFRAPATVAPLLLYNTIYNTWYIKLQRRIHAERVKFWLVSTFIL